MKSNSKYLAVTLMLAALCCGVQGRERTDIVVATDGRGDFRSIQDAINSISTGNATPVIILVRNGLYNEKICIEESHITLVGENRDSTRIVYAELQSNWTKSRDNRPDGSNEDLDWGSAVVNIGKGATDVTLANLTVHNNYGSLHGNHELQFAIRGFDATRISFLYCNIISDGGDAVALWNRESGMYYHSNCSFEGWVDYVCPRGWCYITQSRFFGHNKSASLWHDGSNNKNQKFVITDSYFDGVPGFPLGRHHRDGQFYLLNCTFSENMADKPIYFPRESPNAKEWVWGKRHYYFGCKRIGGDFAWLADNLHEAEGAPEPSAITARWTFDNQWDPEAHIAPVLPFASFPKPGSNSKKFADGNITFTWVPGRNATAYNVYFGTTQQPQFRARTLAARFEPGKLSARTTYYWRVDTITEDGEITGELWSFTTN